jgi:hypothetical protein
MADIAALRTALRRMGLSQDAAEYLTDTQGMDTLAEFRILTDDEVETLCKVLRRPGGTTGNPPVPHPGFAVSVRAETNLKLMCYLLRYRERTSRTIAAADISTISVRALKVHREWEMTHKDVNPPELSDKDWPRTIEAIQEWLRGCLGTTKIPLAYVIRQDDAVTPEVDDPPTNYSTKMKELIARAPIRDANGAYTQDFLADREMVWEKLSSLTREHDCWSYVRPAQRTTDGRLAFNGLKGHYLGPNNVDNMAASAERILATTTYHGETRRWNFEKYVKMHVDQHHILHGLQEHGHSGIDVRSKVRHLLDGVRTSAYDSVKTRIMSDAALRTDFDACVTLYKDFIKQNDARSNTKERDATVAAAKFQYHPNVDVAPDMSVEDRYYSRKEYSKLSVAKQAGLRQKRKQRGHDHSSRARKRNNGNKAKIPKFSKRDIKAIAQQIKSLPTENDTDDGYEEEEDVPKKTATPNRNNKALQRKKN